MLSEYKVTTGTIFVGLMVFLASSCATFSLLYMFMPRYVPKDAILMVNAIQEVPIVHNGSPVVVIPTPVQLKISSIDVAAIVNPVGLTPLGDMDIDDNIDQVAWYKLGPKPGEEGSAVIAGHYGWKNGEGSIFNDLQSLAVGDEVSTVGENGQAIRFRITRTAIYKPDQDATDVFKSADNKAHLNLVTCKGRWISAQSTYTDRLVVFSDLIE